MDKPGKDKTLNHSNFSVSGQAEQDPEAEKQEDGGRVDDPCDEGGDDGLPEGQHDAHLHPANQGDQQCGGGQAEHGVGEQGEAQPHGVHEGGGGGGDQAQQVESREASGGQVALGSHVQARVRDGFGGEVLKRSYWRKRMVPDGLVQRRIDQFSSIVPKLGVGEISASYSVSKLGSVTQILNSGPNMNMNIFIILILTK